MKQRVKLILAFLTEPDFLFLDEPGTNLDKFGIGKAVELAKAREKSGLITFIASNDPIETAHCKKTIEV
jgi:ABC-type multidrug transport system ATPase subunit